jgi:hypothetical protein
VWRHRATDDRTAAWERRIRQRVQRLLTHGRAHRQRLLLFGDRLIQQLLESGDLQHGLQRAAEIGHVLHGWVFLIALQRVELQRVTGEAHR